MNEHERELTRLRDLMTFQARVDEFLESAMRRRISLAEAMRETLPLLCQALAAERVWLRTLGEDLRPWSHAADAAGEATLPVDEARAADALVADAREAAGELGPRLLLARRLDVAGESFGTLAALVPGPVSGEGRADRLATLHAAAEVVDNYLAAIRDAREKQVLLEGIHEALRHPLVHEGVRRAVELISGSVRFEVLVVLYHLREELQSTFHYLVFRGPELEFSSLERVSSELDRRLRDSPLTGPGAGMVLLTNAEVEHRRVVGSDAGREDVAGLPSEEVLGVLGYSECLETVLIEGLDRGKVLGKLVVASKRPLSTYERDVVGLFADVLQKRVVDYNRVGERLHSMFALPTVMRLLNEEDPLARLAPRAADIGMLYADVSSFTALSEQILREPALVSRFIDVWSRGATQELWRHGGVFDKLVGDCVIGLFGPPYHEWSPEQRVAACARAAVAILRFTRGMIDHPAAAPIRAAGAPLGVAIGLHHGPTSVGLFGPNQDFTAFSTAMNNTARLQGQATRDEILVMEPMKELLEPQGFRFGPRREGKAKNVAEPLVFYALDHERVNL